MSSLLIITDVNVLQNNINKVMKSFLNIPGIYVSINKTQKSTEFILQKEGIDTNKVFFIDCVTAEKTREDVLHIAPRDIDLLATATKTFIHDIKTQKYLIIDALSTLLIYNNENKVARFIKDIIDNSHDNNVTVIAFSPKTKGEELSNRQVCRRLLIPVYFY